VAGAIVLASKSMPPPVNSGMYPKMPPDPTVSMVVASPLLRSATCPECTIHTSSGTRVA
jgi:hypothetical protein